MFNINSEAAKKVLGVGSALFMGVVAVVNALGDQKKERELEQMRKDIELLKNQK